MAVPRNGERVEVESDGVEVSKRLEEGEYPVPTVTFEIVSKRDDAASVRLEDSVPSSVDSADLEFHPEYGKENWSIEEGRATFCRDLEPGGDVRTLFAIRDEDAPVDAFLVEPERLTVTPRDGEAATSGSTSAAIEDRVATIEDGDDVESESETSDAADGDPQESEPEASETGELVIPEVQSEASADGTDGDLTLDLEAETLDVGSTDVTDALLHELRTGAVTPTQREALREELDLSTGSVDARLSRLQTDVASLQAYTDALEEFLDEHGTGKQLIEDFEERLAAAEGDIGGLDAAVEENQDQLDDVVGTTDAIEADLDALRTDLDALESTIENLEADVNTVETSLPDDQDIATELASIDEEIADIREWKSRLEGALAPKATDEVEAE